jgi:hypothetical protein
MGVFYFALELPQVALEFCLLEQFSESSFTRERAPDETADGIGKPHECIVGFLLADASDLPGSNPHAVELCPEVVHQRLLQAVYKYSRTHTGVDLDRSRGGLDRILQVIVAAPVDCVIQCALEGGRREHSIDIGQACSEAW